MNTVLIMNCTEIKTNKERPVKLTVGSVKHGCYKQLVVKKCFNTVFNASDCWLEIFKMLWLRKKAAYSVNFSGHIQNTSALQT
jgi:hypothetical protein